MTQYRVNMLFPDGTEDEQDEIFDTEEEANEYGCYLCGCYREGGEILYMSNPGDYPFDEDDEADFEIIEVDE